MILAITGASGVGKTSILKALSHKMQDDSSLRFFHFDEMELPNWEEVEDAQKWQEEATIAWVDQLVAAAQKDQVHVLFEGSTNMKFYHQGFEKHGYSDYEILLFDCSEKTMEERLIQRGQPELYQAQMVNWLHYLRREAIAQQIEIIKTDEASIAEIGQYIVEKLK